MSQALLGKEVVEAMRKEMAEAISSFGRPLSVGIVYAGTNPVIESFIGKKQRFGASVGVSTEVYRFPESCTTEELITKIHDLVSMHDGIIVQLPLPEGIDVDAVLDAVPFSKDIDMLSSSAREYLAEGNNELLPGVPGAMREFAERNNISFHGKKVVIVGRGKLVGAPVVAWLKTIHVTPEIITRSTPNSEELFKTADIILTGAGVPGLIKADMIKEGVVVFDGGTSEQAGKLEGDLSPGAYSKTSFYTPVPGGIGPITVACLFKNLLILVKK